MRVITKTCKYCKKPFKALVSDHKRGRAKYCSRSCSAKDTVHKRIPKKVPNVVCAKCHKKFYKQKSKQVNSKSGLFFCSRKCKDSAQKIGGIIQIQPPHYGTGNSVHTYRKLAFKKMINRCAICHSTKYVSLYPVHHIDFNRSNNFINNLLIVCPTCHTVIHAFNAKRIMISDPVELQLFENLQILNKINRK